MLTEGQIFYSKSALTSFTREDVLEGRVIKISPALITIADGLVGTIETKELQQRIENHVLDLLDHHIRTFHLDINFPDYSGFGSSRPDLNTGVFSPSFLAHLNDVVRDRGGFLTLHLLTDFPQNRLNAFVEIPFAAVCFQLDAIPSAHHLTPLIEDILQMGACASPVIETVGARQTLLRSKEEVLDFLGPFLSEIGMLTIQTAGTAARSNTEQGALARDIGGSYLTFLRQAFDGTIQIQGGVKTETIGEVVKLGAEFLVCGTEIFRNTEGRSAGEVVEGMLAEAAKALEDQANR